MANFGPKPWTNSWKNHNFSTFLTSFFYFLENRVFALEFYKIHFDDLDYLKLPR